jgi:hypothetical protein
MKNIIKYSLISAFVVCYVLITLIGQLQLLAYWMNTDENSHSVASARDSRPFDTRPILIQGKHLPLTEKVNVPSEVFIKAINFPEIKAFQICWIDVPLSLSSHYSYIRFQPRDPPQA